MQSCLILTSTDFPSIETQIVRGIWDFRINPNQCSQLFGIKEYFRIWWKLATEKWDKMHVHGNSPFLVKHSRFSCRPSFYLLASCGSERSLGLQAVPWEVDQYPSFFTPNLMFSAKRYCLVTMGKVPEMAIWWCFRDILGFLGKYWWFYLLIHSFIHNHSSTLEVIIEHLPGVSTGQCPVILWWTKYRCYSCYYGAYISWWVRC